MEYLIGVDAYIVYKNKVVIQKRSMNSKNYPGYYIFPGGKVEEKESPVDCVIREIKEETGIQLKKNDLKLKVVTKNIHMDINRIYIGYTFKIVLKEFQEAVSSYEGEVEWVNISSIKDTENFVPGYKLALDVLNSNDDKILFCNLECVGWEISKILSLIEL